MDRFRDIAAAITSVAILAAFAVTIAGVRHEQAQLRADMAALPRVETFDAGLGDWTFTVLSAPDGRTLAFTLDGSDIATLPLPPRKPE